MVGNSAAGMINFSGCHLACNFCYTPETSVGKRGTDYNPGEFLELLWKLKLSGAGNVNLISPTHYWRKIRGALTQFGAESGLPLVLKISGYETPALIASMAEICDVFVPDFKVWYTRSARACNLPDNYGPQALEAIQQMMKTHTPTWDPNLKLCRGILIRHLLMPEYCTDSLAIIDQLKKLRFSGVLNLMTHFHDPATKRLISAPAAEVEEAKALMADAPFALLINGRGMEVSYAAA